MKEMQETQETWVSLLDQEDPLEEDMADHFSVLARRIPWTEEPGGLQSIQSQRVGNKKQLSIHSYPINNVVIVSSEQQRDSAIHIYVSILPQTPLPSRLPHNTEKTSICYTVSPCWFSILNISVCACLSQIPLLSLLLILAIPFSRESPQLRDQTQVSRIAG